MATERARRSAGEDAARAALERFRANHPTRRLVHDGIEWSYVVGGVGPHTVLYLPGGVGQAASAFTALGKLEREFRVVSVSYPVVPSMAALTDGVVAILDREEAPAAQVWGTSFGGMVAQCLVRRAPHRVSSLVLSNTAAPSQRRAGRSRRQLTVVARLPEPLVGWLLRAATARQLSELDHATARFWRSYVRESVASRSREIVMNLSRLTADFYDSAFSPEDLSGWPGRILLLFAEDDQLYREMHGSLRRLYPEAEVELLPGGHAASAARDERYLSSALPFLRSAAAAPAPSGPASTAPGPQPPEG